MTQHGNPIRVLVVDDEKQMTSFIAAYLHNEGYQVVQVHSGPEALSLLANDPGYDIVLLDWMMPGMNGLDVCREIRRSSEIPIIFLTAKTDEIEKILGLEIGGDDYITKPFSLRELEVRIRVLLRRKPSRTNAAEMAAEPAQSQMITRGSLTIDLPKHAVYLNGKSIPVTPTEIKLLVTLAQHPGRVYTRMDLLEIALGEEYSGYERSIDTHIRNLRKKLEHDFHNPKLILTVHGVGYKFGDAT